MEISLVTMPSKRTMASFFTAASKRSRQHIENKTAANEGEVGGGCDKNVDGEGLIKIESPILF